jgi:hypothetical protein
MNRHLDTGVLWLLAIGCFSLGGVLGWAMGQDSTRCADFKGQPVCITTAGDTTHAYDPKEGP